MERQRNQAGKAPTGVFAEWQPRYAEKGIATFPVREKKPAVSGYLKIGTRASGEFAIRFPLEDAFGLACKRNGITVLDVDAPDERLLADAMSEVGPSPFVVRSGSGNFQAWYRHNGEGRRVRPDPTRPIDILGDGFVVAPPSKGAKGSYEIISGSLDDLTSLPTMRSPAPAEPALTLPQSDLVASGQRNNALWRQCMMHVGRAPMSFNELMEFAVNENRSMFYEPLPDDEVIRVVASAWDMEARGENWFGKGGRVVIQAAEIDDLLQRYPDAFTLLTILRRHHWGREFVIANAMCETMPGGGWARKRFTTARHRLLQLGTIEEVAPAGGKGRPARYRFKGGQN